MFPQHFPPNLKLARLGPLPYFPFKIQCVYKKGTFTNSHSLVNVSFSWPPHFTFYIFTHSRLQNCPLSPPTISNLSLLNLVCHSKRPCVTCLFIRWHVSLLIFPESGDSMCNCGSVYVQFPDCDTAYFSLNGEFSHSIQIFEICRIVE